MVRDVSWIDKKLPSTKKTAGLLSPSRVEHMAIWLGAETSETGRVAYGNGLETQVAPTVFGVYPEELGVHSVPVDVTPDGKVSRIYPPTYLASDMPVIGVGDAGEMILESQSLTRAHGEHLAELDETIAEIDEHNRDVVDPFIRDADHALTVELPAAKQAASDAQSKALEALERGNKGVSDAAAAQETADAALANMENLWAWTSEWKPGAGLTVEPRRMVADQSKTGQFDNRALGMPKPYPGGRRYRIIATVSNPTAVEGRLRLAAYKYTTTGSYVSSIGVTGNSDTIPAGADRLVCSIDFEVAYSGTAAAWGPVFYLDWTGLVMDDVRVVDSTDIAAAEEKASNALYIGNLAHELAQGMVWVDETEPPFDSRVDGQVWIKVNKDGQMEGVYRLRDATAQTAQWDIFTTLTGLLIVPGENGVPTIVDQNGLTVGQIMADAITTGVLAAESVGAKQLIIGDISRAHLDEAVDGVLADAEEIASRVVIEPSSITISRSVVGSQGALTALRLEATKMDFVVDGKSVAYIDSDRNLMSIGNAYVRDSLQIGEHQVRRLGQGGITVFQYVGG